MRPVWEVEELWANAGSEAEAERYAEMLAVWDKVDRAQMWRLDGSLTVGRLCEWLGLLEAKGGGDVEVRVAAWEGCRQVQAPVGEVLVVDGVLYLFPAGAGEGLSDVVREALFPS